MAPMAPMADEHHREILAAINALRADLRAGGAELQEPEPIESETLEVEARSEIDQEQVSAIKRELIGIEEAIERTKKELATLHNNKLAGDRFVGVTDELDEVVKGTERATDSILESAEIIENDARNLAAALSREGDQNMAYEIQEQTTKIFEACNFQDLTGQRITKVVNTMHFVEERVLKMIEIWGGLDAFKCIEAEEMPNMAGNDDLLHGPGDNEADEDRSSQDDIDALFG